MISFWISYNIFLIWPLFRNRYNNFIGFLVNLVTPKGHFVINLPLGHRLFWYWFMPDWLLSAQNNASLSWFIFSGRLRYRGCNTGLQGFRKGEKPDFCLSEFSYYTEHLWIWKAIYGADIIYLEKLDEVSFYLSKRVASES